MRLPRWIKRKNWDYEKPKDTTAKKVIDENGDGDKDEICLFCQQGYKFHPLDPYYTVRTLCSGKHIRP